MGAEYVKKYVGQDLQRYVKSVRGKEINLEAVKANGAQLPLKMRITDVKGSFSIMLGRNVMFDGQRELAYLWLSSTKWKHWSRCRTSLSSASSVVYPMRILFSK